MKCIAVACRFLREKSPTGTQRSAARLLAATLPYLRNSTRLFAPKTAAIPDGLSKENLPDSRRWDHFWEQFVFPFVDKKPLLWTLMGTGPFLFGTRRHVMVVHDLNFLLIPSAFSVTFRLWYRLSCALAARRARRIVCFSHYVKESLVTRLKIPTDKIEVIHQAPGIEKMSRVTMISPPDSYFLCVGSLQPHKNLATVLAAWKQFAPRHPEYRLVVVGRRQDRFSALPFDAKDLQFPGLEFTGYVDDVSLTQLYRQATAFIYPSSEEGFGLPVVEAFYSGCPVITSNVSCLPEIAGNAGILIHPTDDTALVSVMEKLVAGPDFRAERAAAALERSFAFDWAVTGEQMARILTEEAR